MRRVGYIAVFTLAISLFFTLLVYSLPTQQVNTCPGKPYPVSNFLTRGLQGLTGLNWGAAKIVESQIEKHVKKSLDKGQVKVHIKPYSAMDLLAGKLKSFDVKANNVVIDGFFISSAEAKSLCSFTHIDYEKDPIVALAPILLGYKVTFTENDLNSIISSKEYKDNLTKIKLKFSNSDISLIEFLNPDIDIDGNKVFISADMHFIGTPKFVIIPVKMGTGLKVKNNRIRLNDVKILSNTFGKNMTIISEFLEKMTLAVFDINSLGSENTEITIKNINVNNDRIDIEGTFWIASKQYQYK
ncbi:MAG: hypothetical protein A2255_07930 [Candidatus Melainabacteria bacterium RIFOXYA2_FULL_32_9]|nr:MAG: hypothetical protein A2255_07930 [Candidatus Melainabacteria bacterium RIFOXYA2_FULL_32_9]